MNKLNYHVTYFANASQGRIFIKVDLPIDTEAAIMAIEKEIEKALGVENVGITSFTLMRE